MFQGSREAWILQQCCSTKPYHSCEASFCSLISSVFFVVVIPQYWHCNYNYRQLAFKVCIFERNLNVMKNRAILSFLTYCIDWYIYNMLRVMIVRDSCLTESQGPYHLFDPDHFISIHFSFKGGEKLGNEIKSCLSYTITSRRCAVMIGVEPDGSKQKDFL